MSSTAAAGAGGDNPTENADPLIIPSDPPRKRRRRTAATGAAEDCFACRKKQTPCDRVRPFCGQCLEMGKECSGYRTVLTWGVGVASRGKLRGMSLPIPTSTPPKVETSPPDAKAEISPSSMTASLQKKALDGDQTSPNKRKRSSVKTESDIDTLRHSSFNSGPSFALPPYPDWQAQRLVPQPPIERSNSYTPASRPDRNLHLSVDGLPFSSTPSSLSSGNTTTTASYTSSPWEQQSDYSANSEPPTFIDPFDRHRGQAQPFKPTDHRANMPSYRPFHPIGLLNPVPADMNLWNNGAYAAQNIPSPPIDSQPLNQSPFDEDAAWTFSLSPNSNKSDYYFDAPTAQDDEESGSPTSSNALVPSFCRSSLDMPFFHLPRRMQALLDYYDKAICPVLVAFDDQSNPYRFHIMHYAMQNTGLQNAIAALVTNNMRMKEYKHVPRLKYEKDSPPPQAMNCSKATAEEQYYKTAAVQQLNSQLADLSVRSDDSVLAAILILCLFHVCNSGFSKFKTQLAGVQKLLRMRSRAVHSDFEGWVEMFFAWFDVMNSAVNDRETEIRGDSLDMMDLSANLGALERFSGCDGRLFKLIARLGRLNLLSQSREVRYDPTAPAIELRPAIAEKAFNGAGFPDDRAAFWSEWHAIRERLFDWRFTPTDDCDDSGVMGLTQRSLEDISESFRYSALLYTERLANPQLPSSSNNFQALVGRSLSHIEALGINSCVTKFMLWPLFITGTECVEQRDRDLIRDRCVEIQEESGFYNNLNGLYLLEKVWQENDAQGPGPLPPSTQAFRWRKAMDRVDGEYIVI